MACEQLDPFISSTISSTPMPRRYPGEVPRPYPAEATHVHSAEVIAEGVQAAPFGRLTRAVREAICDRAAVQPETELGQVIARGLVEAQVNWRLVPLDEIKQLVVDAARACRAHVN